MDIANTIASTNAKPSGAPRRPQAVPSMPMKPPPQTSAPISSVATCGGARWASCTASVSGAAIHSSGAIWRSLPRAGEVWSPMLRINMPTDADAATTGPVST